MNTVPVKAYQGLTIEDLNKQLLEETDVANVRDIIRQLNTHLQKKDIIRKTKLSDLQDKIQDQIEQRINERGDCFSNRDLLDYYKTMDDAINRIDSNEDTVTPQIKVNQPITINMDKPTLSREEKMQVLNAVKSIISKVQDEQLAKNNVVEGEFKEIGNDTK